MGLGSGVWGLPEGGTLPYWGAEEFEDQIWSQMGFLKVVVLKGWIFQSLPKSGQPVY